MVRYSEERKHALIEKIMSQHKVWPPELIDESIRVLDGLPALGPKASGKGPATESKKVQVLAQLLQP